MSFQVRKAERQGARLLIQLSGVSGSGKTYTALQLAYGLAGNDASKVVLIDTENRRGSLYANALPQAFGAQGGNLSQVRIGEGYAPVQWAVMDAAELAPTLEKADNQYRDRNRAAAQAQVREIAAVVKRHIADLMDGGEAAEAQPGERRKAS